MGLQGMMLGQKATEADWHFRKIALAGEDWGRIISYEGTAMVQAGAKVA